MTFPHLDTHPGVPVTAAGIEGLDEISDELARLQDMLNVAMPASPMQLLAREYNTRRAVRKLQDHTLALRVNGDTVDADALEANDTYLTLTSCYRACKEHYDLHYDDAHTLRTAFDDACAAYMQRARIAPDLDDEHRAWIHDDVAPQLIQAAYEDALAKDPR